MEWLRSLMLPPQGSQFAGEVDNVYMGLFWLCGILFVGIAAAAIGFAWRYRYKPGRVTPHQTHNTTLEIVWTVIPLLLCVAIFFWGLNGWMKYAVAPGEAMEIQITAKKWLWQFEYPDGTRTANEIHVVLNKPVRFVMTSEDVLHDFFVPDMRVKHDIIPGRYTEVWFTPTVPGTHHVTCAEYCGKGHSDMRAKLEGYLGQDGKNERRQGGAGGCRLRSRIDDAAAGQDRGGIRSDHADVSGLAAGARNSGTHRVYQIPGQ